MITPTLRLKLPKSIVVTTYEISSNEDKNKVAQELTSDLIYYSLEKTIQIHTHNIFTLPRSNKLVQVATVKQSNGDPMQRMINELGLGRGAKLKNLLTDQGLLSKPSIPSALIERT